MRGVWFGMLAGIFAMGCDSLVDQSFRGEPIATLEMHVESEGSRVMPLRPRAAAFWASSIDAADLGAMREQTSSSQPVSDGSLYTLHLFEPPEPLIAWDPRAQSGPKFAIGRIGVYDDRNGNARRDTDEAFVGGLGAYALIYAPERLPARVGPSRLPVEKGLTFAWAPLPCAPDMPATDATCGVPIGEMCHGDQDCAGGVCLDRFNFPWPDGACAVKTGPCVPAQGAFLIGGPGGPYYAKACTRDADCGDRWPYRCDPLQGACVPFNTPRVSLGTILSIPFCAKPPPVGM